MFFRTKEIKELKELINNLEGQVVTQCNKLKKAQEEKKKIETELQITRAKKELKENKIKIIKNIAEQKAVGISYQAKVNRILKEIARE